MRDYDHELIITVLNDVVRDFRGGEPEAVGANVMHLVRTALSEGPPADAQGHTIRLTHGLLDPRQLLAEAISCCSMMCATQWLQSKASEHGSIIVELEDPPWVSPISLSDALSDQLRGCLRVGRP